MKRSIILSAVLSSVFLASTEAFAALSCSVTAAASCTSPSTIILRMSSASGAHSELPSQSTSAYDSNVICCSGVSGIGNSCSGTYAVVAKMSSTTNAHIERNTLSNYSNNACFSISSGTVSIGYQSSSCSGYDTTIASMSSTTSAHVGSSTAYANKICATASANGGAQSLTFSISDNAVGFGSLSSGAANYATGDASGSATEVEAHQLTASTNAGLGYTITVQGATLASGSNTITPIGSINIGSLPGTEQFGLRMTATGGVGTVSVPYAVSGFAYAGTAIVASPVAVAASGDGVATTYSVRYISNIAGNTEAGSYTANLVYIATANF